MDLARARHVMAVLLVGAVLAGCTSVPTAAGTVSSALTFGGTAYPLPDPSTKASASATSGASTASPRTSKATRSRPATVTPASTGPAGSTRGAATSAGTASTTGPATADSAATLRPTTAAPDTAGLSAQEIKDRTAIEAAWLKYWDVTIPLLKTPPARRRSVLATVAGDPLLTDVMGAIAKFVSNGMDNYGYLAHAIYWGPSVDGNHNAVFGDCMDSSHLGSLNVRSGVKLTVGHTHDNTHVTVERAAGGGWRVTQIQFLHGVKC